MSQEVILTQRSASGRYSLQRKISPEPNKALGFDADGELTTIDAVGGDAISEAELSASQALQDAVIADIQANTLDQPTGTGYWYSTAGSLSSTAVALPWSLQVALSDETTAITTGTAKITFRMPHAVTLTAVRASLATASSSGTPTFDINEGGVSILSTPITIDATEKTSTTAATPPVISDAALADDAEITIDIDVAGTGAKGAKITLIGTR